MGSVHPGFLGLNGDQTAQECRWSTTGMWTPGAAVLQPRGGIVPYPGSANLVGIGGTMQATVSPFQGITPGTSTTTQGAYPLTLSASKTITFDNGGSVTRNDRVVAAVKENLFDSSGLNEADIYIVKGDTTTGALNNMPASAIELWRVAVPASASAGSGGLNIAAIRSDQRPWTTAVGGILPVPTAAIRDALPTPFEGQTTWQMDTDWVLGYTGSAWRVLYMPPVASTSDLTSIPSPPTNTLVACTADNMVYRYNGSTWVASIALGGTTSATRHEASYYRTSGGQIIVTNDNRRLLCNTTDYACDDVSANHAVDGGTELTINRAGVWSFTASVTFPASASGEKYIALADSNDLEWRYAAAGSSGQSGTWSGSVSTTKRCTAGDKICAVVWQSSGSSLTTVIAGGNQHISATWIRP